MKRIGYLHPLKFPLKDPPEVRLSKRLVQVLDAQRRLGAPAYPLSFQRLAQLTDLAASDKLLREAVRVSPFGDQVLLAGKLHPDTPVSFATDLEQLAGSSQLLHFLMHKLRGPQRQAFSVAELKKGLESRLKQMFEDNVCRQMENNQLPPGVGWFCIAGNKKYLILIQDIHQAASAAPLQTPAISQKTAAPIPNFVQAFEESFAQLNREKGSHNFVSLLDLRRVVPAAREIFDAELRQLRLSGRYTLSAAEGRHGLLPEEREAGILEDGVLLLYVAKKVS